MYKIFTTLSSITIILMISSYVSAEPELDFKGPLISISDSEMIIDIGQAEKSSIVSHELKFINKGSSVLIIESLEACCGRRAELLTDKETAPNETGIIRFSFNTRNRTGEVLERIIINTNETGRKKLTLYVRIEVKP